MAVVRFASRSPYAPVVGFSGAVRAGDRVHVSGITALDDTGAVVGGDDPYEQARHALHTIGDLLVAAGSDLDHVVQTRLYLTRVESAEGVGQAHRETFAQQPPAATMVVVAALLDPRMLVEIEAVAVLPASS